MRRYVVQESAVEHNIERICQAAGKAQVYAVVKADGYGTGCAPLVKICARKGLKRYAVTAFTEAEIVAREVPDFSEILMLPSVSDCETIVKMLNLGVTFTVSCSGDIENIEKVRYLGRKQPKVQIKIDTGMGRRGFLPEQTEKLIDIYREYRDEYDFVGIYTHFSNSMNADVTRMQYEQFLAVLSELANANIDVGIRHCCNSAAAFYYPDMALDAVRIGSALFGRIYGWEEKKLMKTGFCQAQIENVRLLHSGSTIGYGSGYVARHDVKTAVCSVGSHNGFGVIRSAGVQTFRSSVADILRFARARFSKKYQLSATVKGIKCPVLGAVGSETVVLDVSGVDCQAGDMAVFDINPMLLGQMEVAYI